MEWCVPSLWINNHHVKSIRVMNSLNEDIRMAVSERVFKTKLKSKQLSLYEID